MGNELCKLNISVSHFQWRVQHLYLLLSCTSTTDSWLLPLLNAGMWSGACHRFSDVKPPVNMPLCSVRSCQPHDHSGFRNTLSAWDTNTAGCPIPSDSAWGWDGQREFGGIVEYPIPYHGCLGLLYRGKFSWDPNFILCYLHLIRVF